MNATYGQSQGIRLLEAAVQELGPLFTRQALRPLAERQGLSEGHLAQLLSRLNASGQIAVLKRGVYLVRSPLYAGEIHPFAIAVQPVAISHWSALAHHSFTTQLPTVVQATTTAAVITPEMRQPALAHRGEPVVKATGEDDGYPILCRVNANQAAYLLRRLVHQGQLSRQGARRGTCYTLAEQGNMRKE